MNTTFFSPFFLGQGDTWTGQYARRCRRILSSLFSSSCRAEPARRSFTLTSRGVSCLPGMPGLVAFSFIFLVILNFDFFFWLAVEHAIQRDCDPEVPFQEYPLGVSLHFHRFSWSESCERFRAFECQPREGAVSTRVESAF